MTRALLICFSLFFSSFFPATSQLAFADEPVIEQTQTFPKEENPEGYFDEESTSPHQIIDVRALFFKTVILLTGLCGLVIAGGYFLKRFAGGKFSSYSPNGNIQLIERKYLSPKTSLWLVDVKDQPIIVVDSQYGVAIHSLKENSKPEQTSPQ